MLEVDKYIVRIKMRHDGGEDDMLENFGTN